MLLHVVPPCKHLSAVFARDIHVLLIRDFVLLSVGFVVDPDVTMHVSLLRRLFTAAYGAFMTFPVLLFPVAPICREYREETLDSMGCRCRRRGGWRTYLRRDFEVSTSEHLSHGYCLSVGCVPDGSP